MPDDFLESPACTKWGAARSPASPVFVDAVVLARPLSVGLADLIDDTKALVISPARTSIRST
jgi:hypothetical protein